MKKKIKNYNWLLLMLIVMAIVFYFWPAPESKQKLYDLEKTGSGIIVDYSRTANQLHKAVDSAIKKHNFQVLDVKNFVRQVPRQSVEGVIRWHTRNLNIPITNQVSVSHFEQSLRHELKNEYPGELLSINHDFYNGQPVTRFDIGFKDVLDKDTVTIITDRIYITAKKSLAPDSSVLPNDQQGIKRAKMAIVIDDFGYSKEPIELFAAIDRPVTFSVLPARPFSHIAAIDALRAGKEVMLHLPMEPLDRKAQSEKVTIETDMTAAEIRKIVTQHINAVPGIKGINNHQGSRATGDERVMREVLKIIKEKDYFFVDSHTHSSTVAFDIAQIMKVRTGINEVFLDNQADVEHIKRKIEQGIQLALEQQTVIVIGHARATTAEAIVQMIPRLDEAGVELVYASEIVK